MPQPDKGSSAPVKRKTLIGVIGAAAALIVTPFVSGWESGGTPRLVAYQDIVKVWTICGGETLGVKPGMVETVEGCALRDEAALIRHAEPVLACTPGLRTHSNQLSAAISLAYPPRPPRTIAVDRPLVSFMTDSETNTKGGDFMRYWPVGKPVR